MNNVIPVSRKSGKRDLHKSFNDQKISYLYPCGMWTKQEAGRRLAAAREENNFTLEAVCAKVPGLVASTLNSYELGSRMLPVNIAKKLAPIYRVSAAYLLTVSDDRTEDALIQMYRQADERGKATIRRVAESESPSPKDDDIAA